MKNGIKKFISAILLLTFAVTFTACGGTKAASNDKAKTKIDEIKAAGKIVLGTSADYPPYEFHKVVNGKDTIVGFDIKIAEEIAKELGVELEIKDMKFEGLLAALEAGNIDFIVAGMVPTEERQKSVDFSKIYYQAIQSVVVKAVDKDKLKTIDDLKGLSVAAQKTTTQETIVKEQMTGSTLKALGKITDIVMELQNGKVSAAVIELPVAQAYANNNKDIVVSDIKVLNEDKGAAIAIKKGNPELVETINKVLDKLMADKAIDKFVTEANEMVE